MTNTGCTYQRTDGRWVAALQIDGKRKSVYAKTEKQARQKLAELQHQAAKSGTLPDPGRRSVNDLLDLWLEAAAPTLKPGTLADYRDVCRRHIRPTLGHVKLSRLAPEHLQRLYNDLHAQGLTRLPSLVHSHLHKALGMAARWGWLASNPADRVDVPRGRAKRKPIWSPDDLCRFIEEASEHRFYSLWVTAATSGCRIGELSALKWQDVDLDHHAITIRGTARKVEGEWLTTTPKTRAGERTITLPAEGIAALRRQRVQQAEWKLRAGPTWQDKGLVFTTEQGEPVTRSMALHALQRVCKKLGLPIVSPHDLRHTHATLLLSKGVPVPAVSARLGHANASITMSVYAHAFRRQDEEAADAIGKVLAAGKAATMV